MVRRHLDNSSKVLPKKIVSKKRTKEILTSRPTRPKTRITSLRPFFHLVRHPDGVVVVAEKEGVGNSTS